MGQNKNIKYGRGRNRKYNINGKQQQKNEFPKASFCDEPFYIHPVGLARFFMIAFQLSLVCSVSVVR